MKKWLKRIGIFICVLIACVVLTVFYLFRWASEPAVIMDDETGIVSFGYDKVKGKWLINEPNSYELGIDGPHILYGTNELVYIKPSDKGCTLSRTPLQQIPESLICMVDNSERDVFYFRLKDSLTINPFIYEMPGRLFVISDIEGSFQSLAKLLTGNGVTDKDLHWTYGDGHLLLNGDFVDRGSNVTQCLWLIYRLEEEALKAGGKVHYILGNHEQMNLYGSVKYVDGKYRELANRLDIQYKELFSDGTELGRWLRTHNAIEKIGATLFMHGGMSPEVAASGLSLERMNEICRRDMDINRRDLTEPHSKLLLGNLGPLWYRGLVRENKEAILTQAQVDDILKKAGVNRIVVGHTVVSDVSQDYNGKVIRTDVKHTEKEPQALLIEGGKLFRTNTKAQRVPI